MSWGLAGAFAAAVTYGVATILQAVGARRIGRAAAPDARLAWRLVHSAPYLVGLALDAVGFALSLAALRSQPLFIVQAIVASSLAVTALLAVVVMRTRLNGIEIIALAMVTAGLVMLALSARSEKAASIGFAARLSLFAGVAVVALLAAAAARRPRSSSRNEAWALGSLAGLMYGAGGIAARVLHDPRSLRHLLVDPALYTLAFAGILGLLLYAMAVQRGRVTVATSAVVVTQTLVPAALGITLLDDRPAHGRTTLAAIGFAVTVIGSLLLARYGEAPPHRDEADERQTAELVA